MFKVFLGFMLALAFAVVIRFVYELGQRKAMRQVQHVMREVHVVMKEIDAKAQKEVEKRKVVRKKK